MARRPVPVAFSPLTLSGRRLRGRDYPAANLGGNFLLENNIVSFFVEAATAMDLFTASVYFGSKVLEYMAARENRLAAQWNNRTACVQLETVKLLDRAG